MAKKLEIGDVFPVMTLNLVGGGTATLPDLGDAKYHGDPLLSGSLVTLLPPAVGRF